MREKDVICFKLLGSFSFSDILPNDAARREIEYRPIPGKIGKKMLSFLQYLVVNHTRNITAEELIDTFWTEKSSNPANALRNMLFKIRELLKEMFPDQANLLQTLQGCYAWNPGVCIELDVDEFEKTCLMARQESDGKSKALLKKAANLYGGDFLSGNDSEWVLSSRQYYRTLYIDACKALLPMQEKKEEWLDIISVCSQAYQADAYAEEFTAYQMQAFIAMGQPEQAAEKYEIYRKRLLKDLGIAPTEQLERIYSLAQGLRKEEWGDDSEIFRIVSEGNSGKSAFFCSFGVFRSIVALEKRHLARTGQSSVLVIVSLGKNAVPNTDVRRLERILMEGLRTGDPVARLEAGSYILMLTGTDTENAQIVISRLDCAFHKTYRHSRAQLTFRISNLCP